MKSKIFLALVIFISLQTTAIAKIYGDPQEAFSMPIDNKKLENNDYYRCLIIKKIKPGEDRITEAQLAKYNIFSEYSAKLYAQSVKISAYIEKENEKDEFNVNTENEMKFLKKVITPRILRLARRMNIINSFEASILAMESLQKIDDMNNKTYSIISDEIASCEELSGKNAGGNNE